jgi:hypothetical protein
MEDSSNNNINLNKELEELQIKIKKLEGKLNDNPLS